MVSRLILSYADYGTPIETGTVAVNGTAITAATHDAVKAQMDALADAIDGITLGNRFKTQYLADLSEQVKTKPANKFAQRETKWLVTYHTSGLGTKGRCELPCADLSLIAIDTDGVADTSVQAVADFIAAFQAYVKVGAESVVVDEIRFVGRNT